MPVVSFIRKLETRGRSLNSY
ncbi:hypothetical protein Goshw_019114 [Gossypium schwendimanii]|uniref:Uncharacterized protein n=1 Tax=Gossypium schwendimanii TaxID=34291 RepID=A0A7J9L4D7_GOSSC|nr:hypothetical protein [Gossypium schwendimanii]